jgi:lysophospholipid acyltransferase (LPLAT)-like uncharacterized protein
MSFKSDLIMSLGCTLGPAVIKTLGMTWMVKATGTSYYFRRMFGSRIRAVYAFWHSDILLLSYFHRNEDIRVLISEHRDGELIARIVHKMGFSTIRGSTTRGGMKALRSLNGFAEDPSGCDLAFTPDGPKGPAKKLQKGVIFAASKTGFPIVPVQVAVDRCWEMNSWDRFKIPKPFSRSVICYGSEISIPEHLEADELERYRTLVESAMHRTEEKARTALQSWLNGRAS